MHRHTIGLDDESESKMNDILAFMTKQGLRGSANPSFLFRVLLKQCPSLEELKDKFDQEKKNAARKNKKPKAAPKK